MLTHQIGAKKRSQCQATILRLARRAFGIRLGSEINRGNVIPSVTLITGCDRGYSVTPASDYYLLTASFQ